ncbi:Uncharacterized protein DAT39_005035 [Clarias magur]|uniref:Uncharacterized protein n=1 Tax=Clarias magur TaxID=1594786 RepID=A0A8J4UD55_CLAMG|nr:Uncharacterized protein DAT39_005035 [Clarias magur]
MSFSPFRTNKAGCIRSHEGGSLAAHQAAGRPQENGTAAGKGRSRINHQSCCSLLTTGSSHVGNNDLSNAGISIQINKAVFLRAVNQITLIHQIQEVTSTVSELEVN